MIKLYLTPSTRAGRVAWLLEELNLKYELEVLPFTKEGLKSVSYTHQTLPTILLV